MNRGAVRLQVADLHVAYGDSCVLRGVDLELRSGELTILTGQNGSGKTTLLNALSGFVSSRQGTAALDGRSLLGLSPAKRAALGLGRTFQTPRVFEQIRVLDCLMLASYGGHLPPAWAALLPTPSLRASEVRHEARCRGLLERMGWTQLASQQAGELSHGQRKLLALCQTCLSPATAMLLDEPVAGVDQRQRQLAITLLGEWLERDRRHCLLVATHEPLTVPRAPSRLVHLAQGRAWKAEGP